jgi:hypothetical protein
VLENDEIQLGRGGLAAPGTAIAFRAERGASWQGSTEELAATVNAGDVGRLVVLDTWLLNCDRSPPQDRGRRNNYDNVFLSEDGAPKGKFLLTAFDHTHCFTCGRDLSGNLATIGNVKDPRIYGLFPEFRSFLDKAEVESAVDRLRQLDRQIAEEVVEQVADDWEVQRDVRTSLTRLIVERAEFVQGTIVPALFP